MRGHNLRALGVVDDGKLVGIVAPEDIVGHADTENVAEAMRPVAVTLSLDDPIRTVAETLVASHLDFAPVVQGEQFVGIVSAGVLLKELGRSWDPLTNLSWSDGLREWGVEHLRAGQEICVVFLDLDDFGMYNKKYGHVVGDRVLKIVADLLRESVDDDRDVVVRYGGDEFAVGTLMHRSECDKFVESLHAKLAAQFSDETVRPATFSVGVSGGLRTKERENVHIMSTLDSLINIASRESELRKPRRTAPAPEAALAVAASLEAPPGPPLTAPPQQMSAAKVEHSPTVVMVSVDESGGGGTTSVWLGLNGNVLSGVHLRETAPLIESVAIATSDALRKAYPGVTLQVDNIFLTENPAGTKLVGIACQLIENGSKLAVGATQEVGEDLYRDIAEATIAAFLSRPQHSEATPRQTEDDGDENGESA